MSIKDQLFRKYPSDEIVNKVLSTFMISDIDDQKTFSKLDMKSMKTIDKLHEIADELENYYVPCKARTYLVYIDEKTALTILRQIIRTRNRILLSHEKFFNGKKYTLYSISKVFSKNYKPIYVEENKEKDENLKKSLCTVYFD
jgi:hypothetical protein